VPVSNLPRKTSGRTAQKAPLRSPADCVGCSRREGDRSEERVDEEQFSYQVTKDSRMLISWHDKRASVLKEGRAHKLISELPGMECEQLALARVTGDFKRATSVRVGSQRRRRSRERTTSKKVGVRKRPWPGAGS
jgi:hypothetical protein